MPKPMTVKELIKLFAPKSKWRVVSKVHEGYKYETWEDHVTVHSVCRVRRQWEEPGKEIIFKHKDGGWSSLLTSEITKISDCRKKDGSGYVRVVLGGGASHSDTFDYQIAHPGVKTLKGRRGSNPQPVSSS